MSESLLKKEFEENDLARIRNLISKKFNDSTRTQTGYRKQRVDRVEAEIWEENGKTWTIHNGIRQTVGKLDEIKHLFTFPLLCPKCQQPMNHPLDKRFYGFTKSCFDCVVKFEEHLRLTGKFQEYQTEVIGNSAIDMLNDMEKEMEEFINSQETFVTEQGDIEDWGGGNNKEKIRAEMKEYINSIKSKLNI